MRTYNTGRGTTFHFNADFSGYVIIYTRHGQVEIPGSDILELVAEYIRTKRVEEIEQMSIEELL